MRVVAGSRIVAYESNKQLGVEMHPFMAVHPRRLGPSAFQQATKFAAPHVRRARRARHGRTGILGGATNGRREATEACPQKAVEYRETRGVVQWKSLFSERAKATPRGKAEVPGSGLRQFVAAAPHDPLVERPRRIKPLEARPPVSEWSPNGAGGRRLP